MRLLAARKLHRPAALLILTRRQLLLLPRIREIISRQSRIRLEPHRFTGGRDGRIPLAHLHMMRGNAVVRNGEIGPRFQSLFDRVNAIAKSSRPVVCRRLALA